MYISIITYFSTYQFLGRRGVLKLIFVSVGECATDLESYVWNCALVSISHLITILLVYKYNEEL